MVVQGIVLKTCTKCKKAKSLDLFHNNKNNKDGKMYICITCRRNYKKEYYKKTADHQRKRSREYHNDHPNHNKEYILKSKYGISINDKIEMLKNQNNKCFGCNKSLVETSSNIDHDHKTGKIRGLLCNNCNLTLGLVYDNISILQNLIRYLKRNNNE